MKTVVFDSKLNELNEMVDLPKEVEGKHILYVGAREGQIIRTLMKNKVACGWWDLKKAGYLDDRGFLVKDLFRDFDMIVFSHPRRVYRPVRKMYKRLIKAVEAI